MKDKIVKYTFDRTSGEFLNSEVKEGETNNIYIDGVVDILCKGLMEYIDKEEDVSGYNI